MVRLVMAVQMIFMSVLDNARRSRGLSDSQTLYSTHGVVSSSASPSPFCFSGPDLLLWSDILNTGFIHPLMHILLVAPCRTRSYESMNLKISFKI